MMDFALSSVRLTASGVEMSGLGAPFLHGERQAESRDDGRAAGDDVAGFERFRKRCKQQRYVQSLPARNRLPGAYSSAIRHPDLRTRLSFEALK